jgi:hypothetical protein
MIAEVAAEEVELERTRETGSSRSASRSRRGGASSRRQSPTAGRERLAVYGGVDVALPWLGTSYRVERLLEAPLTSADFERRIVTDLARIKNLIKEVTLGAHVGPQVRALPKQGSPETVGYGTQRSRDSSSATDLDA